MSRRRRKGATFTEAEWLAALAEAIDHGGELVADGKAAYKADWKRRAAAVDVLNRISEAGRHLSEEAKRAMPGLPFTELAALRNDTIHHYPMDYSEEVWTTLERRAAGWAEEVASYREEFGKGEGR